MELSLETLELTLEELAAAREEVRRLAYQKWEQAGRPRNADPLHFWYEAETEWIECYYVPDRYPVESLA